MHIGNHNFCFVNIRYDAVFNGLSESVIKISAGVTLTEKWSKYKMTKNSEKRFFKKIAVSVAQYFNFCRSILNANEKFLETKMISERRSTNTVSLS